MMEPWKLGLMVTLLVQLMIVGGQGECPKKCICQKRHVRCMYQGLETIPRVPADTLILDLRFNKIRDIPKGAFSNLNDLTTLLLNNNHITILRDKVFYGLSNLQFLYLYKNRIHHMDDGAFDGLNQMKQLYLHFNNIEFFSDAVFPDLPSLERLFLHNNRIKHIPPGAFDDLPSLKRLRLDGNAIVCDCSITWFMKMIDDHSSPQGQLQTAATCNAPDNMKGLSLVNMDKNDLHCEGPTIMHGPKDLKVNFGGAAIFTCQVNGNPLPEIKWMKDSQEISFYDQKFQLLEDGTLKIDNTIEEDEGFYECVATSPMGETKSKSARMVVTNEAGITEAAPTFVRTPLSVTLKKDQTALSLECEARGVPKPHISWFHNDNRLALTHKVKIVNGGSLLLINITEEETGQYRCEAENIHGKIFSVADIRLPGPPKGLIVEEPAIYKYGQPLTIKCSIHGHPTPIVTWFKDGSILRTSAKTAINGNHVLLKDLDESNFGTYLCRAENSEGFIELSTDIKVKKYSVVPPVLVYKPYDMEAFLGSKIEMPCKSEGNPIPKILWKKDGSNLFKTERHKISQGGSLYIDKIIQDDSGRYECTAVNEYGRATASGFVTILTEFSNKPGDRFVKIAFAEATKEVDLAINKTVDSLFGDGSTRPNMGDLYRIIRYPNAADRELARAGEVYERTLVNIRRHVNAGKSVNITKDFSYREILSSDHLNLVAKLSGCIAHRLTTNCTNMCYHLKYRSIDGTCNNFNNPTWGASSTAFRRILKPIYENGFGQPVGWSKERKYNNFDLPSARLVSSKLITTEEVTPDSQISHMVMQWGQFLDHDLDHATPSVSSQSWDGIDCKRSCEYAAPCFPIDIPKGDSRVGNRRCMDFIRSSAVCGSGMTSVFFDEIQPREQINQLTSYIDASQVYGFAGYVAQDLRNLSSNEGLMRSGVIFPGKKALLPYSSGTHEMDCRRGPVEDNIKCFAAGDIRANEQVGLLAMHTIWFREHNRIATQLKRLNPHWNGDNLYHEARKIVGAEMQHITYKHWLPIILGPSGIQKLGTYQGYDSSKNPTIANVFATAALRFGHSLINPVLQRLDNNFNEIPEGHLPLHKAFFASWRLVEEGGVDPLLRGLFTVPAKLKTPGQNLNSELTEKLFHVAHAVALDLAAMNVQRSRDHAIPAYTEWRKFCNLSEANSFDDLQGEISSPEVREKLREIYGSVHNIDVWVGGILEDQVEGAKVGPLFQCLLVDQFQRLRDGDRFWYENPTVFKGEQLTQIKEVTLSRILCDNGDNIDKVTHDMFILPEAQGGFIGCEQVPKVELRMWADCTDCEGGFCSITSPQDTAQRRRRRSIDGQSPLHNDANHQKLQTSNNELERMEGKKHYLENLLTETQKLKTLKIETLTEFKDIIKIVKDILEEFHVAIEFQNNAIENMDEDKFCKAQCKIERKAEEANKN